jgi:hypothetical protein
MERERTRWPALMRPDTLAAYLDCGSPSDFSRMMARLKEFGYPGPDPRFRRHVKAMVDRFINPAALDEDAEERMKARKAAGLS